MQETAIIIFSLIFNFLLDLLNQSDVSKANISH